MACARCGSEIPAGADVCPKCGWRPSASTSADRPFEASVDALAEDAERAARELAKATAQLAARLAAGAGRAADDPRGAVKAGLKRVGRELDAVAKDLEKLLKEK